MLHEHELKQAIAENIGKKLWKQAASWCLEAIKKIQQ
jgi:hypothetical protein